MKSVVLIGAVTPLMQLNIRTDETLSAQTIKDHASVVESELVQVALALRKLNVEVHVVSKIGIDPLGLAIQSSLEASGCIVYAIAQEITSTIYQSEGNVNLAYQATIQESYSIDDIPFIAFDHCDAGILFQNDEQLLEKLLARSVKTMWITNRFVPEPLPLIFKTSAAIISKEELDLQYPDSLPEKIFSRLLTLELSWILYFDQYTVSLITQEGQSIATLSGNSQQLLSKRALIIALMMVQPLPHINLQQFPTLTQLFDNKL